MASCNSRNLWFLGLGEVAALGSQSFEVIHLGLYRDNGKENGNYSIIIGYMLGLCRGHIGFKIRPLLGSNCSMKMLSNQGKATVEACKTVVSTNWGTPILTYFPRRYIPESGDLHKCNPDFGKPHILAAVQSLRASLALLQVSPSLVVQLLAS